VTNVRDLALYSLNLRQLFYNGGTPGASWQKAAPRTLKYPPPLGAPRQSPQRKKVKVRSNYVSKRASESIVEYLTCRSPWQNNPKFRHVAGCVGLFYCVSRGGTLAMLRIAGYAPDMLSQISEVTELQMGLSRTLDTTEQ
jgi:hypothetical protein